MNFEFYIYTGCYESNINTLFDYLLTSTEWALHFTNYSCEKICRLVK